MQQGQCRMMYFTIYINAPSSHVGWSGQNAICWKMQTSFPLKQWRILTEIPESSWLLLCCFRSLGAVPCSAGWLSCTQRNSSCPQAFQVSGCNNELCGTDPEEKKRKEGWRLNFKEDAASELANTKNVVENRMNKKTLFMPSICTMSKQSGIF